MSAARVEALARASGLLPGGEPVVVMLSGGPDSVCLLDLAVRLAGADAVAALHVEYGLREGAQEDERLCRELCGSLGVPLTVRRARRPPGGDGNLQAWARAERHAAALELARARDARVATGHTASDQVEGVLYRLAASPGRRALLGMRPRDGRLVRPLVGATRAEVAASNAERGLRSREDPTNASAAYARNRARHALVPALAALHPAAERNVLRTLDLLRDEAAVLDAVVEEALERAQGEVAALRALAPALRRLALQVLADRAAGGRAPAIGHRAEEVLALAPGGGSAALDLGEGLRAWVEYGRLRIARAGDDPSAAPDAVVLAVPGRVPYGGGEVVGTRGRDLPVGEGTLDAAALGPAVELRAPRPGDRVRPLGMGGRSRALADVLGERRIPRARRAQLPVAVSAGEIAWVPGVVTGEPFRVAGAGERVRLEWRP